MNIVLAADNKLDLPRGDKVRILALANGLSEQGHNVTLVAAQHHGPIRGLEHYYNNIQVVVPENLPTGDSYSQTLRRKASLFKAASRLPHDILQVETAFDAGIARLAGVSNYAVDIHGFLFAEIEFNHGSFHVRNPPVMSRAIEKYGVVGAHTAISVSPDMSAYLIERWGVPPGRIVLARNGYIPERLAEVPTSERSSGKIPTATFIGNLARWASVDKVLGAAEYLLKREFDIQFEIVGDGQDRARLEAIAAKRGLANVQFRGYLPTNVAYQRMANSTVLLCPLHDVLALRVACPIKLIEYAALGNVMVVDNVGELPRRLKQAEAAVVTSDASERTYAAAIVAAISDEGMRRSLRARAREFGRKLTWHSAASEIHAKYLAGA